jgi:hypothetical protein
LNLKYPQKDCSLRLGHQLMSFWERIELWRFLPNQWINQLMDLWCDGIIGVVETRRWGLLGEIQLQEACLWRGYLTSRAFLSRYLSVSSLPWGEQLSRHDALTSHQAPRKRAGWPWIERSQTMNQNKSFILQISFLWYFIPAMKNWLTYDHSYFLPSQSTSSSSYLLSLEWKCCELLVN